MAIQKVLGTETEYGIVVRGDVGFNPAVASSLVVNSYPGARVKIQLNGLTPDLKQSVFRRWG